MFELSISGPAGILTICHLRLAGALQIKEDKKQPSTESFMMAMTEEKECDTGQVDREDASS